MIVAMYHDQGLVPLKRVDFGRSVNWTLGLPIVRTSVDHGTADDLVGTGRARCDSMGAALDLAVAQRTLPGWSVAMPIDIAAGAMLGVPIGLGWTKPTEDEDILSGD
jgi:hypothetical protein